MFLGFDKNNIVKDVSTADTYNVTKQGSSIPRKRVMKAMGKNPNTKPVAGANISKKPAAKNSKKHVSVTMLKRPAAAGSLKKPADEVSLTMIEAGM